MQLMAETHVDTEKKPIAMRIENARLATTMKRPHGDHLVPSMQTLQALHNGIACFLADGITLFEAGSHADLAFGACIKVDDRNVA